MDYKELYDKYKGYSKKNVSYEEYVRLCYEMAEQDTNPEYAVAELKESERLNKGEGFRYDYEKGRTVASLVYCNTL